MQSPIDEFLIEQDKINIKERKKKKKNTHNQLGFDPLPMEADLDGQRMKETIPLIDRDSDFPGVGEFSKVLKPW